MRDDVLADLAERVVSDAAFRQRAREDLDAALQEGGFELEDDEMEAVRSFHSEYVESPDDELVSNLRRQGG